MVRFVQEGMSEIVFEVREDEVDGGYTAHALGYGTHTQGDMLEELRAMVRDAVACYFDDASQSLKIIRLHFVRDEVLVQCDSHATLLDPGW
jgi:hypothetical protein